MKKIITFSVLSFILMIYTTTSTTFAANNNDKIVKELETVAEENNIQTVPSDSLPKNTPIVEFDSVEEFEKALKGEGKTDMAVLMKQAILASGELPEIIDEYNAQDIDEVTTPSTIMYSASKASTAKKNGSARIKIYPGSWNPIKNQFLPMTMWIDFSYQYTGSGKSRKFTKITKVTSNSVGFPSSWHQTTKATNFYDSNKGVSIKIQGYHLLGVAIGGQAVGYKIAETYTKKYHF